MKKLIVTFVLTILSILTYAQSGVGYLNYTIYNIYNNGAGAYAYSSSDFVNMFDVTKGATVYSNGTTIANNVLYFNGSFFTSVPNGGNYFGIKATGYFVPKETGTYIFAIDGDDGVDFSLNGNVVTAFYGPHGFGGYRYGSINLVAGQAYTFMSRFQQWGGGWGMYLIWKRPSQSTYSVQLDEVYSNAVTPTLNVAFNFNNLTNPTLFSANVYNLANNVFTTTPTNTPTAISSADTVVVNSSIDTNKVNGNYKTQYLQLTTSTNLTTLYNSIVTVSDVYLAFQEYSNKGLLGNTMGTYFASAVQYINADVNFDGQFNETDCYLLLQHLTGQQSLITSLPNLIKLYNKSTYDSINHNNWNLYAGTHNFFPFTLNTSTYNYKYNVSVAWLGDVNMSNSTTQTAGVATFSVPTSNQIYSSIMTQLVGDSIYATISLDPAQQLVVGTQYHLNYDSSILKFQRMDFNTVNNSTNFKKDEGNYINFGSLITDGSTFLNSTTKYRAVYTSNIKLKNVLGLITITPIDAVNQIGNQLKIGIN